MNILLLVPPLSVKDRYGSDLGKVGPVCEPLGLAYIGRTLRDSGHIVTILDTLALDLNYDAIKEYVCHNQFDVIGVSLLTPMYSRAIDCIRLIKSVVDVPVLVGGPHVTIFPRLTLEENPEVDFGLYGEAELSVVAFCNALEQELCESRSSAHGQKKQASHSARWEHIDGLVYRDNGAVIVNSPAEMLSQLDDIPVPSRDLLPMERYTPTASYYKKLPSYIMLTSRLGALP